jgi:hypothetical protein
VTLGHASPLKKLDCILSLGQEQSVRGALDRDVEEVMEIPKICHGELGVEPIDDALKEGRRGGGEDDVVDVQQQAGKTTTLLVHKEGDVGGRRSEPKLADVRGKTLVPRPRSLLQTIE